MYIISFLVKKYAKTGNITYPFWYPNEVSYTNIQDYKNHLQKLNKHIADGNVCNVLTFIN